MGMNQYHLIFSIKRKIDAAIKGTDKGILWAVIASPNVQKAHEFTESCFFFFARHTLNCQNEKESKNSSGLDFVTTAGNLPTG